VAFKILCTIKHDITSINLIDIKFASAQVLEGQIGIPS
jgi:hypothetical protein